MFVLLSGFWCCLVDFTLTQPGRLDHHLINGQLSDDYHIRTYIGPKIASLILRDLVYIRKLEKYLIKPQDYCYLQPIDVWVHKLSKKLGLVNRDEIYHEEEARDITNRCFELNVNPIHYNQGLWYIGTQSLEILLKLLPKINLEPYLT